MKLHAHVPTAGILALDLQSTNQHEKNTELQAVPGFREGGGLFGVHEAPSSLAEWMAQKESELYIYHYLFLPKKCVKFMNSGSEHLMSRLPWEVAIALWCLELKGPTPPQKKTFWLEEVGLSDTPSHSHPKTGLMGCTNTLAISRVETLSTAKGYAIFADESVSYLVHPMYNVILAGFFLFVFET